MKINAKNPTNEAQPKRTILNSSIKDILDFGRPVFSSAIRRFGKIGLFSIACAASAVTAHAQVSEWDGAGTSSNWSDYNNWASGIRPTTGSVIHFAGGVDLTPNNDLTLVGSQAANSIIFDSGASAFTLSGNAITLTGGITNNSSYAQAINMPVQLSGAQTFSAASGALSFGSTVDLMGSALTVSGSNIVTFNGVISDSSSGGSLTVTNKGGVLLNAANTYTGSTNVNGGMLILNGSIASAQTTIASSGTLAGNGTVGGNVTNNGILFPIGGLTSGLSNAFVISGASGSSNISIPLGSNNVLTIKGNYTQGANGALGIIYGGAAPSQHTALNVQGQADLAGRLVVIPVNGARLTAGQQVPIVTSTGGVNGTFSLVEYATPLNATVVYEPNSVILEVLQTPQTNLVNTLSAIAGISPNYLALAKGLDAAANDPRAAKIFNVLNSDSLNQLIKDVGHIDPDKLTSMSTVGGATSGVHLQNLQMRMQALQSGATGFSAMGLHVTDNSNTDLTAGYAGPSGPEGKGGKEVVPPPVDNRWGTFITGAGEFDRVGDTQTARGFNLDSGGITLGVDFRFTDHFVAGIFAGYTYTGIDISDGRIAVDTGKFGIYATYFDGGFYVNSAVQGGYDGYETNRTSLGGIAHSSPTGGDFNLLFAPGYNWTVGGLTFGPTSRFQYSYESVNGFTESGSLAPLTVGSQHTESIVSAFGVKASYDWKVGTTIIRPELRLEWEHEYGDVATSIASQLASGAGNSFTVTGPEIGRDDMHLGAGVSVVFSDRLTAYVYYDGQYFRTNYDSSTVTGGFRFLF
jgi:autotransporter-associated beta strand protein